MRISYRSGYKYQLAKDYVFHLPNGFPEITHNGMFLGVYGRRVTLREGYASDGASGPTIDTENTIRGAFEHDGTYQLIRCNLYPDNLRKKLRKLADRKLNQTLREDGMWWPRRKIWFIGLRLFGAAAANPKNAKKIKRAGR